MNLPTLTVVVPNFNHAHYLADCLQALFDQSVPPTEVIVIDDASTDDSVAIIQRFAQAHPTLRLIRNAQNQGVLDGMNRSLELARGEFLYFAAADDKVLPGLFEKSLRILAEHPQSGLCCTVGEWWDPEAGTWWRSGENFTDHPCHIPPERVVKLIQRNQLHFAGHTVVLRRAALVQAGKFILDLKWQTDWFAMCVVSFRHGICFVPEPLAVMRVHHATFSATGMNNPVLQREVLRHILELLGRAEYQDVTGFFRRSGVLALFEWSLLKLMLSRPEYRRLAAPIYLRKVTWRVFKTVLRSWLPAAVEDWYHRARGFKHQSTAVKDSC